MTCFLCAQVAAPALGGESLITALGARATLSSKRGEPSDHRPNRTGGLRDLGARALQVGL